MTKEAVFIFPNNMEKKLSYQDQTQLTIELIVAQDTTDYNKDWLFTSFPATSRYYDKYLIVEICDGKYYLEEIK